MIQVVLLTGRMRPLDREEMFGVATVPTSVAGRVTAGTPRDTAHRPIIVVSTQTIEAGADLDFDAIVTECASLDALRQRFGRLDRRGELQQSRATILVRRDQAADSKDDPVYGEALSNTWKWLETKADKARCVDFGIEHLPSLPRKRDERAALCSPVLHAPVLLPAHLHAWAQTSPCGEPDADVALWLHGPGRGTPEVRIVWRADLEEERLRNSDDQALVEAYATASLAVAPPSSLEAISVPMQAFKAWLSSGAAVDLTDVEGGDTAAADSDNRDAPQPPVHPFLIVDKSGAKVHRTLRGLYPEATVVVPASYGGIRHGNWNPEALEPVTDLGDIAQLFHRGRPMLRLVPDVLSSSAGDLGNRRSSGGVPEADEDESASMLLLPPVPQLPSIEEPELELNIAVRGWLEDVRERSSQHLTLIARALLEQPKHLRVIVLAGGPFLAVSNRRLSDERVREYRSDVDGLSDIVSDDDDSASYIGSEVGLEQHLNDVAACARKFALNVGLPGTIADDVAAAARLHDIGKADPRFQQMLHGGSAVRMAASKQLLAKSAGDSRDRSAQTQARVLSKYPEGYRHELLSVAMLEGNRDALAGMNDPNLVLHLVGSHHGWCRPFAPAVEPGESIDVSLHLHDTSFIADTRHNLADFGSTVAERYWGLTERYGWWTLAWLEAIVRLADHRASEASALGEPATAARSGKKRGGRV